jgi:AcrR family transcriptional regulator
VSEQVRQRRRYDSPVRRQQAAETRDRIVAAGSELIHEGPLWDWGGLTVRAVAARAGVNERTVYRHFTSERELRDAVLRRLEEEAGVKVEGLKLDELAGHTEQLLSYVSSFPVKPRALRDAASMETDRRRRDALLGAVAPATADWPERDRRIVAGLLDVLWSLVSYERLVTAWELEPADATRAITWAMELVREAVHDGRVPGANGTP